VDAVSAGSSYGRGHSDSRRGDRRDRRVARPGTSSASAGRRAAPGRALAAQLQLQSGARSCQHVTAEAFEHVGEYVMGRALAPPALTRRSTTACGDARRGRRAAHARADGSALHRLSDGRRPATPGLRWPGMMGGAKGSGRGAMMRARDWSRMGDARRSMSRQDWQRLQRQWMAARSIASVHHGWSTGRDCRRTPGGVLLVAVAVIGVLAVLWPPGRRSPAGPRPLM
jgi:hypothetical protein